MRRSRSQSRGRFPGYTPEDDSRLCNGPLVLAPRARRERARLAQSHSPPRPRSGPCHAEACGRAKVHPRLQDSDAAATSRREETKESPCASSPASSRPAHKHLGNYIGGFRQYVATQELGEAFFCIVDLHSITVEYDPDELRAADARPVRRCCFATGLDPERSTIFAQSHVPAHAEAAWLLARRDELRRVAPDDAVQGQGRQAGVRLGGPLHVPGADGGRHPALPDRPRPDRRRPASAPRARPRRRRPLQRSASARRSRSPTASTRRSARGSWTCRSRKARCRRPAARAQGTVLVADPPDVIRKKFKIAVTDSGTRGRAARRTSPASRTCRDHVRRDRRGARGDRGPLRRPGLRAVQERTSPRR